MPLEPDSPDPLSRSLNRINQFITETRASIDQFLRYNVSTGDGYEIELNRLSLDQRWITNQAMVIGLEMDLLDLRRRVNGALAVEKSNSATMQHTMARHVDAAESKLAALSLLVTKGKEHDYGPMRDMFRRMLDEQRWAVEKQLDDGRRLGGITETSALESVRAPLERLSAHIDEAIAGLKAGGSVKTGIVSVESFHHQLDEMRRQLEHRTVHTYMPVTQVKLLDRVATLSTSVSSMPLADSSTEIEKCRLALAEAKTLADNKRQDYAAFETTIKAAGAQLDKRFDNAPDYRREKQADLARFLADGLAEGTLDDLYQQLGRWQQDIMSVRTQPGELAIRQTDAKKRADEAEKNEVRWRGYYDDYIKRVKALTPLLSSNPVRQVFDKNRMELEQLAKAADRAFKTNHDFDAALAQLKVAHERADFLEKYPSSTGLTTLANLPRVNDRWRHAVAGLGSGFDALREAVQSAAVPDAVLEAVSRKLAELKLQFDPAAFEEAIAQLTDPGVAAARKASVRELALRTFRRLRDFIENNSDLAALADNPFHPALYADIVNANLVLVDMQTNLLSCL
jgi:hypothetical protein